ncbi:MAG: single-stranded-DNA-specific exonuclease RecJ [Cyanobacteria bacterium K_Offshore_surface_m2_011]|nr:single-stranded-DNA-specific exonuclease RecJ [Cyanobacteria bacterium K_Offshore_surface_m2_011]
MLSAVDERRWLLPSPLGGDGPTEAAGAPDADLPGELLALLRRRGLVTAEAVRQLLDPEAAPDPEAHFPALALAVERLVRCCQGVEAVAICGDYDADGMTSTALLVGVLQRLGARPRAAIPSRMDDGYGLNAAMVERLAADGVRLLITVDNGVAAIEALERAAALEVEVILTDHHTLPPQLPPHLALLHPAVTPEGSPYRGLAGVGLAHVLATALCRRLRHRHGLEIALNLFCIGTIADMAPLEGVNRRWLLDGLPLLGRSPLPGLQALQQLAGLEKHRVDAEAVGFQLAPRINAVGRLGDPQLVVDLLTTDDPERALELARSCEALNRQRRELCSAIEAEALALLEADGPRRPAFLLLAQGHWHHGVIGIVASRLVERFGRPVALLAGEGGGRLRASVRAPKGFAVDGALTACAELLERYGGHPAAGGFTVRAENVTALQERLDALASGWLESAGDGRTVEPEALLRLERIDREFWRQLQRLAPFGIGHPTPLFWSSRCQVVEQKLLRGGHLQLQLAQGETRLRAIGWRWQGPDQWAGPVDVAYRLRRDDWQGVERFQLELEAIRSSGGDTVVLQRRDRTYWCRRQGDSLVIRNAAGEELRSAIPSDGAGPAALGDPPHPYVQGLMREAAMALGMVEG